MSREIEKYLKWTSVTALFAVLFVPLVISDSLFFPFVTGKNFTFRILVEVAFASWAILAIWSPRYRPSKNALLLSLTAFVGIVFVADIFGENFMRSFWSNFERSEGFVTLLHLWAYFVALTSIFRTKEIWSKFLNTSLIVSIFVGIRGFLQLFGFFVSTQSGTRLDATFGNASYLAVFMLFNVFIAIYLASRNWQEIKWRYLYIFVAVFDAFILLFSATRGAILGLLGGLLLTLLIVAWFERENKTLRKWAVGLIVGLVILSGVFLAIRDTSFVQGIEPLKRIADISLEDRTTQSRFLIWNMAFEGFKEKPILGYGQENFIFVFDKHYNPDMWAQEPWFDRAHNVFFDWLIAGGLLGLLSYLSIFVFALWFIWKKTDFSVLETGIMTGLLAGYFFQNLFVFDQISSYILFISILAFIYFKKEEYISEEKDFEEKPLAPVSLVGPIIGALLIVSIYFFNIPGLSAASTLIQALSPQPEGPSKNLELYQEALSYTDFADMEIREQLLTATNVIRDSQVSADLKNKFLNLAVTEMTEQVEDNPRSARNAAFLGSFLNKSGFFEESENYLMQALGNSPNKQSLHFELINLYLNTKEYGKAVEHAKTALDLAPEYDDARLIYSITLIYNQELEKASKVLTEGFETETYPDGRLARAYFENGLLQKSEDTWRALVLADPSNINYRFSLAATLIEMDKRQEAIEILEEVKVGNPSISEQIDYYINEIKAGRNP